MLTLRSRLAHLRPLRRARARLVLGEIAADGGRLALASGGDARKRWAALGLSLRQRDRAIDDLAAVALVAIHLDRHGITVRTSDPEATP